jgi:hypothetical protein
MVHKRWLRKQFIPTKKSYTEAAQYFYTLSLGAIDV